MTAPANLRGWGQGWPVDRSADMVTVRARRSDTPFVVHREIAPIIDHLVNEVERRGYLLHRRGQVRDDWSYVNRPIRGSNRPSNHSWGLAIDIDATQYPLGSDARLPEWIVTLFKAHGFDYGGDWRRRPDPMHFEFAGWPSDARRIAGALASRKPLPKPPPPPPPAPAPPVDQEDDDDMATFIRLGQPNHRHTGRVEAVTSMHRRWVPKNELDLFTFLGGDVIECPNVAAFNAWTSNKVALGTNPINGPI